MNYGLRVAGYTFVNSIENFSAYCNPVLRGSILLPPHEPIEPRRSDGSLAISNIILTYFVSKCDISTADWAA